MPGDGAGRQPLRRDDLRLDEQIAERLTLELQLAQDVEDLTTQGATRLLELIQEGLVDFAFAGVDRDEIPKVADLPLADTVDSTEALFETVRIPRQVVQSSCGKSPLYHHHA